MPTMPIIVMVGKEILNRLWNNVDSAMSCLNAHYKRYAREPQRYMSLRGEGSRGNYPGGMIFSIRTFMSFWISGMRRLSLFLR